MTQVGTVYGEALYELCHSEALAETVLEQLTVLGKSFVAEPDFLRLLAAPNLTKEERCRILDDSFRGKVHPYVLNFLKIRAEKGYARHSSAFWEGVKHILQTLRLLRNGQMGSLALRERCHRR